MEEKTLKGVIANAVESIAETGKSHNIPLAHKTARLSRLIQRYYSAASRAHGTAAGDAMRGQGRVLALLKNRPQTTQRELQFVLDMRQQSLSELLAKLEEKGFIVRSKSPDDGRVTLIELTEAGAAAAPDVEKIAEKADVFDCLDDEERTAFEDIVDKVSASVSAKLAGLGIDPDSPHPAPSDRRGGPHGRGPCGPQGRGGCGPHDIDAPHGRGPNSHGPHSHGPHSHHGPHRGQRPEGMRVVPDPDEPAAPAAGDAPRHGQSLRAQFEATERDGIRNMTTM